MFEKLSLRNKEEIKRSGERAGRGRQGEQKGMTAQPSPPPPPQLPRFPTGKNEVDEDRPLGEEIVAKLESRFLPADLFPAV